MSRFVDRTALLKTASPLKTKLEFFGIRTVKRVLFVCGSKGGTGKSLLAANLSVLLADKGLQVGLFDADGDNPFLAKLVNVQQQENKHSARYYGIRYVQCHPESAHQQLNNWDILTQLDVTEWGELDILLVDMPSSNRELLSQLAAALPTAEVLLVTTPDSAAIRAAKRDIACCLGKRLKITGVVENMAYGTCSHSSNPLELIDLFGAGNGQRLCHEYRLPLLTSIPFDRNFSRATEQNSLLIRFAQNSFSSQLLQQLAQSLLRN